MKTGLCASVTLCCLVLSATGFAQIPAGQRVGLAVYLKAGYQGLRVNLTAAAEKMPEADYGFKPGTMPEVRTYGQIFAHVAAGQFGVCAALKGVPNPVQTRDLERELKTKAEFVKTLADSFAFCDGAIAALNDVNAADLVPQGKGEVARAAVITGLSAHNSEMYGISTVYLRAKNIVPPSTEKQMMRQGGQQKQK
jgi:hypothetical protein